VQLGAEAGDGGAVVAGEEAVDAARDRERAALAWVEALTHIGNGVPDDLYAEARKEFSEKELVDLTWAAAAINVWNRVSISMRAVPGSYQPKGHPA